MFSKQSMAETTQLDVHVNTLRVNILIWTLNGVGF